MRLFWSFCTVVVAVHSLQAQYIFNTRPARVLGHAQRTLTSTAPNLVEGKELNNPQAVALDANATPPILYVSDTGNNRVLAWRDATRFAMGAAADFVIGQRDLCSTLAHPSSESDSDLPFGLNAPTGLAVDAAGRLYVVDSGNNRILRYPRPTFGTAATGTCSARDPHMPNFIIGQTTAVGRAGSLGNSGISTATSAGPMITALLFDASGNLFFTDAANHRVLRYPAAVLADGQPYGPAADLVLGQADFAASKPLTTPADPNKPEFYTTLTQPSGLALDRDGRLFVTDGLSRTMVFVPPFSSGGRAARYMGMRPTDSPGISEWALSAPQGVFTIDNVPFVVDTYANRILRYDAYAQWPAVETSVTPQARAVFGQGGFSAGKANRGLASPRADTLSLPVQGAYLASTRELFVADSGNSRVVVLGGGNDDISTRGRLDDLGATRLLGQCDVWYNSPNMIEGREFRFSYSVVQGTTVGTVAQAGIAIDDTVQPPRLYVSDPGNHRVLGFKDARKVKPGDAADLVIGQSDLLQSLRNYPTNEASLPNEYGLARPAGLAVDAAGNLYVADGGNGRVVRFPKPFEQTKQACGTGTCVVADLVLGQPNFRTPNTGVVSSNLMASPYGLAISKDGHLLVSDTLHNRVLMFLKPEGRDFTNGMAAASVFGQADLASKDPGNTENRLNGPHLIALDTDDRLYVADAGNNRVLIFNSVLGNRQPSDPLPVGHIQSLYNPYGVFVSKTTGEIWIADTVSRRTIRFPKFDNLIGCLATSSCQSSDTLPKAGQQANWPMPLAVAQDSGGAVYVADLAHRISMYYPAVVAANTASGQGRLAPGLITSVFVQQKLVDASQGVTVLPVAKTLADYQVLVNGVASPVFAIAPVPYAGFPTQINFMIPMNTPPSGEAEFLIARASTGEIVGSNSFTMDGASPALFSLNQQGSGQAAALNWPEYTVNGPSNPIARGKYIMLFGTGQGFVPGAPPDGEAPAGAVPADVPKVVIGSRFVDPTDIVYSGLAPGLVGVWQINVKVPDWVGATNSQPVAVQFRSIPSNVVTIAVK